MRLKKSKKAANECVNYNGEVLEFGQVHVPLPTEIREWQEEYFKKLAPRYSHRVDEAIHRLWRAIDLDDKYYGTFLFADNTSFWLENANEEIIEEFSIFDFDKLNEFLEKYGDYMYVQLAKKHMELIKKSHDEAVNET